MPPAKCWQKPARPFRRKSASGGAASSGVGTVPSLDEAPPPLADFLLYGRSGFCQHFAGGMAVMLRTLGIPARVAVGYTGGRFDTGIDRYVVLDRDAHSWVEVYFPGQGWLPFDPTPGRSAPNPASVSSPDYAPSSRSDGPGRPLPHSGIWRASASADARSAVSTAGTSPPLSGGAPTRSDGVGDGMDVRSV